MVNCKILGNVLRKKSSLSRLGVLNMIAKTQFSKMEKLLECLCVQEKCTFYPFSFNLEKKNTGRERNSRWGGRREQSTTNEERWLCVSENSRHHPVETSHLPLSSQSVSSFEFPGIVLEAQWDTHDT